MRKACAILVFGVLSAQMAVAQCGLPSTNDFYCTNWSYVWIEMTPPRQLLGGCSSALAWAENNGCGNAPDTLIERDYQEACPGASSAGGGTQRGPNGDVYMEAYANVTSSCVISASRHCRLPCNSGEFGSGFGSGWATAFGIYGAVPGPAPRRSTLTAEYRLDIDTDAATTLERQVHFVVVDNAVISLVYQMFVDGLSIDSGLSVDVATGDLVGSDTVSVPTTEVYLRTVQFGFADVDLDVNQDGRFNQLDVDGLVFEAIDPNEPNYPGNPAATWNFDDDLDIDADDQAILQAFVDAGLGAGILGDDNGDGVVDCSDLRDYSGDIGLELGDAGYKVALDYDLNGRIELIDTHAVQHAVVPGDADGDGTCGLTDLATTIANVGAAAGSPGYTTLGDLDLNGVIDLSDLAIVLGNFGSGCS